MKKNKKRKNKNWTAISEVRHVTPKSGYAFKDRRRLQSDKQSKSEIKNLGFFVYSYIN